MPLATAINTLAQFCGPRDVATLTPAALEAKYGFAQADVAVLFGGSIVVGGDVLATAIKQGVAKHYLIVGGHGHTTPRLRAEFARVCPQLAPAGPSEAALFAAYLRAKH